MGSLAPYGTPGFNYFPRRGDVYVDDIRLYFSDPDLARRKGVEARDQMLQGTTDQVAELMQAVLYPVDAAVQTGEVGEFFV